MKKIKLLSYGLMIGALLGSYSANAQMTAEEKSAYIKMEEEKRALKDNGFKTGHHSNQHPHNHSPLSHEQKEKFTKLAYYPVNPDYKMKVTYEKLKDQVEITMPFKNGHAHKYLKHGIITFELNGQKYQLSAYQNVAKSKHDKEYADYLFIPFKDKTNGETTFGGGRYIQWHVPDGKFDEIDFNNAFNPYCVYNPKTKCPIPPAENHLDVKIEAGEKDFEL